MNAKDVPPQIAEGLPGHQLKIEPGHFRDIELGLKEYEVRKDDRGFKVGNVVVLLEYHGAYGYVGGVIRGRIKHVLHGGYGLHPGFVVLGLADLEIFETGLLGFGEGWRPCVREPPEAHPLDDGEPPDPDDDRRIDDVT